MFALRQRVGLVAATGTIASLAFFPAYPAYPAAAAQGTVIVIAPHPLGRTAATATTSPCPSMTPLHPGQLQGVTIPPQTGLPTATTGPIDNSGQAPGPPPPIPPQTGLPTATIGPLPSSNPCTVYSGDLLQRIWTAANSFIGTPTGNLPGGGVTSCAAAMQVIVKNATGALIADAGVDTWRSIALSGQYGGMVLTPATVSEAKAGAIVIVPETVSSEGHIGVCATDGCGSTWSNHSDSGTCSGFAADSCSYPTTHHVIVGDTSMGYETPYLIWEPSHIP